MLRGSYWVEGIDLEHVRHEALALFEEFPEDPDVRELVERIDRAAERSFRGRAWPRHHGLESAGTRFRAGW